MTPVPGRPFRQDAQLTPRTAPSTPRGKIALLRRLPPRPGPRRRDDEEEAGPEEDEERPPLALYRRVGGGHLPAHRQTYLQLLLATTGHSKWCISNNIVETKRLIHATKPCSPMAGQQSSNRRMSLSSPDESFAAYAPLDRALLIKIGFNLDCQAGRIGETIGVLDCVNEDIERAARHVPRNVCVLAGIQIDL